MAEPIELALTLKDVSLIFFKNINMKNNLDKFEPSFPFRFLNSFKWFRRLCGGTWFQLRFHTESLYTFKLWGRWEGGFRTTLLKTETYSLSEFMPSFPFKWLTKHEWFRKFCGGTWHYNRYWWDAGSSCAFWWERFDTGCKGGSACTIKSETY